MGIEVLASQSVGVLLIVPGQVVLVVWKSGVLLDFSVGSVVVFCPSAELAAVLHPLLDRIGSGVKLFQTLADFPV